MTTYSELFFLISSIGFVVIFILFCILLYYLIKTVRSVKNAVEQVRDAGKDLIEDIRSSNRKVGVTSVVMRTLYHLFKKYNEDK